MQGTTITMIRDFINQEIMAVTHAGDIIDRHCCSKAFIYNFL